MNEDHSAGYGLRVARPTISSVPAARARRPIDFGVPPMLYLPVREDAEGIRIAEIRALTDGRRALLAFTALDRLLLACGESQPWALVDLDAIQTLQDEQPFDTVAFDIEIPSSWTTKGWLA